MPNKIPRNQEYKFVNATRARKREFRAFRTLKIQI